METPSMTSIEQKIFACSTELNPDSARQERIRELLSHVSDEDHLITTAVREGLAGFLYRSLATSDTLGSLGRKQDERLTSIYYQTVRFNTKLIHDFKEVLQLLNQKKIRVVLLQGIALLHQIYSDIGLRPMTDIDVWVLEKDFPGVIDALNSLGYEMDPLYPSTFIRGDTSFDLHSHLLWAERIKTRDFLLAKGQEHIYENTRIIDFEGHEGLSLGLYDQVLYLSLHVVKHDAQRLIWLVDIKGLLADWKSSDWEAFIHRARDLGLEKTMVYIFYLLNRLFDFQIPPSAGQILENRKIGFIENKVLRYRVRGDPFPSWASLLLFPSSRGLKGRLEFIIENLFPRPDVLRQVFGDSSESSVWRLYWKRVLQLFGMVFAPFKKKARS